MYFETRSICSDIHLPKENNLTTPRPITDLGVRQTMKKHGHLSNLKVPPKDETILALMAKKGQFEREYWKRQLVNGLAWDTERLDHDKLKLEQTKNHRAKIEVLREEDRHSVYLNKLERQRKRLEKRSLQLKELEKDHQVHDTAFLKQRKRREEEIQKLAGKELERKEQQEKNWWNVNSAEYDRLLEEKRERDRKRLLAVKKREENIHEETKKKAESNEHERVTFTERYVIYEKEFEDGRKALSSRIERQLQSALSNYEQVHKEKLREIHEDALKEEEHLKHAIETHTNIEKQNNKRFKKMLKKTQKNIVAANKKLSNALEEKKHKVHDDIEAKEAEHKKNMKRIKKEMRRWKKKISKDIKRKEEKIKEKQKERSKIMERTRSVAHGSRVLRDYVLDDIGFENFDKKLFRVERFRSLGSRPINQDWNISSINLL